MPRKKIDRKDWRNIAIDQWNTSTVHAMIIELNHEMYSIEKYVPLRGYGFEQGVIKRSLEAYGPTAVKTVIERAFNQYSPTSQYPQLTAGFLLTYMLGRLMPQVLAEQARAAKRVEQSDITAVNNGLTDDEIIDLL